MLKFEDNYPLKNVTTLSIGGPAKKFVKVKTEAELIEAIGYAKREKIQYLVIGGGSNLLVSDEGIDCLVIKNEITGINYTPPRSNFVTPRRWPHGIVGISTSKVGFDFFEVSVKSGAPLQELVDYTISHGLAGLQKLAGIPGTVGGAVYGNAGAYGQTISDHIISVVILSETKNIITLSKEECQFNYRDSIFKQSKDIILEVTFKLENGDPETLQQEAKEVIRKRLVKYPPGIKCPGSFFKNIVAETLPKDILDKIQPEKIVYGKLPAGALLEKVGAKGQSLDNIEIASHHANLFINKGEGSAQAFYNLAKKYAEKVKQKFGITLEPEVQLINLPEF